MLARLKVAKGDILYAVEIGGGYLLTPHDPEIAEQIKLGKKFMEQYQEAFKALAK
jgi:hypothetical protein